MFLCAYQVLDVRPETEAVLTEETRVCAYWSERSRCLYPGYVRRGEKSGISLNCIIMGLPIFVILCLCTCLSCYGLPEVMEFCVFMFHALLIGGSNDECKPGGVMVEFDDGDRGWISLRNIRLLPPGYQIHCGSLRFSTQTKTVNMALHYLIKYIIQIHKKMHIK